MFKPKGIMFFVLIFELWTMSCSGPESDQPLLTAEMPLHLEEHIDDARIEGSEVSEEVFAPVEWDFSEAQPEWKALGPVFSERGAVRIEPTGEALRIHFSEEANRGSVSGRIIGAVYVDLPDWRREDWGDVLVSTRSSDPFTNLILFYNLGERVQPNTNYRSAVLYGGEGTRIISDGNIHTYKLRVDKYNNEWGEWENPLRQLVLYFAGDEPAYLDLLSVKVFPKEHIYADAPVGVRVDERKEAHRRTLYTHTPGRIEYRVQVPQAGRLDFGLGVLREEVPVTFRIVASQTREQKVTIFEETYADPSRWAQRSVDLSAMVGKTVSIALEADTERSGSVALWAAPTLTGTRTTEKPNVIFYVIDGGSSDHMSVYGYNRRTTPNLERLATEGALFENVYSNSAWTWNSTPSFMTSLQSSVMGGQKGYGNIMLPEQEVTIAEHMHRVGYQTAVFTTNTDAATVVGLDRDVDVLRDTYEGVGPDSPSSVELHGDYWRWREAYPGEPYWVHFQTTDVHGPLEPSSPFTGLYISPELRWADRAETDRVLKEAREAGIRNPFNNEAFLRKSGVDLESRLHVNRGVYDEEMAHQDYMLGRFVKRLKEIGEWEHTLLIVAADHGTWAGSFTDARLNMYDPMFRRQVTRVPLLIFWPGHIAGGQSFSQTVSMIDVLPTILDLLSLPMPEIMQGQSLAPLLLGQEGWEPRPVILDEFLADNETGELTGIIEVVDGRWGASLEINPEPDAPEYPYSDRTSPMLLYDLWDDPYTLHSLHEERPDLVKRYTKFLKEQFEAHRNLSKLFTPSGRIALTPEQLETLRSLGYID